MSKKHHSSEKTNRDEQNNFERKENRIRFFVSLNSTKLGSFSCKKDLYNKKLLHILVVTIEYTLKFISSFI